LCEYPNYSDIHHVYESSRLNPNIKWRAYYQEQNALQFKDLVPFNKFGRVVRGIATGSNEYFTFNVTKAQVFSIPETYLLPCICKAIDSKKPFFTATDFNELKRSNKDVFLFNAFNRENENVRKYILLGESSEVNKKYLTSKRNPWYSLENRPPAPIWVSVFNRTGIRFVRNEANIANLTAFHCIYPTSKNIFASGNIDLLFTYLLTDVAKQILNDNSREYGNGLQKFEPNDLNKGMMLDLEKLSKTTEERILALFRLYRNSVINNEVDNTLIDRVNNIFIENYSI